jgi:hypothetical protein
MKHADYALISVKKTEPPEGEQGNNWYQYVVGKGASSLVGKRRGTLKQVTEHAETLADSLNERRGLKVSSYGRHGLKKD